MIYGLSFFIGLFASASGVKTGFGMRSWGTGSIDGVGKGWEARRRTQKFRNETWIRKWILRFGSLWGLIGTAVWAG